LIELLVVVAIIALLLTMILPTLVQAKLLAKRTVCQANLSGLGKAAAMYQTTYGDYVPVSWANYDPAITTNPWKSWYATLLPCTPGAAAFNCPGASDTGPFSPIFHSKQEMCERYGDESTFAGSYGVIYQNAKDGYLTPNYMGQMTRGHPTWSLAFSTLPGVSWRDPTNSIYVADGCFVNGPVTYPTIAFKGGGTSAIVPPDQPGYFDPVKNRRFADRHLGTNCLFLGGHVLSYPTSVLDNMPAGSGCNVWTTE
jgi:prepilin-type processing-associated H-X9-DG protein